MESKALPVVIHSSLVVVMPLWFACVTALSWSVFDPGADAWCRAASRVWVLRLFQKGDYSVSKTQLPLGTEHAALTQASCIPESFLADAEGCGRNCTCETDVQSFSGTIYLNIFLHSSTPWVVDIILPNLEIAMNHTLGLWLVSLSNASACKLRCALAIIYFPLVIRPACLPRLSVTANCGEDTVC